MCCNYLLKLLLYFTFSVVERVVSRIPKWVGGECQETTRLLQIDAEDDAPESRNPLGIEDNR